MPEFVNASIVGLGRNVLSISKAKAERTRVMSGTSHWKNIRCFV